MVLGFAKQIMEFPSVVCFSKIHRPPSRVLGRSRGALTRGKAPARKALRQSVFGSAPGKHRAEVADAEHSERNLCS